MGIVRGMYYISKKKEYVISTRKFPVEVNVSFPMETAKLILAFSVWKPLGIIFRHLSLHIHRLPIGVHAMNDHIWP